MLLETLSVDFRKARAASDAGTSFAAKAPTTTEPAGDGVIDLGSGGVLAQNAALVVPFGTGSDGDVFSLRVIGWRRARAAGKTDLWVPVKLCEVSCTLSGAVGVAGAVVGSGERFADTIALVGTSGNDDVSIDIVSPADDTIAHLVVDLKGSQKLEFAFDPTTGMTDCNALLALL